MPGIPSEVARQARKQGEKLQPIRIRKINQPRFDPEIIWMINSRQRIVK